MSGLNGNNKFLAVGTKVRVTQPSEPPDWSTWEDDSGRTSGQVKKRLQQLFFRGDKRVTAEIVYVSSESERDALKRKGLTKVRVKEAAGSSITITAELANLQKA
jgi:uncharacterized protein YhfF